VTSRRKTRNIVGNVPEPEELYGRGGLVNHVWRQLEGNNILLLAPRRFGKSGVMRHVLLRHRPEYLPIYLDLEDVESPAEFVWRVTGEIIRTEPLRRLVQGVKNLPGQITKWFQDTFDEVQFEGAKVKFKKDLGEDWRPPARRLITGLEKGSATVVFIFDELPAMLERMAAKAGKETAADFLSWFRKVRMQQKDRLRRYRFIVGGSIGIDPILRRLAASEAMNDFERVYVEPLSRADAQQLAGDLAYSLEIQCDEALLGHLLDLIGPPVPYFIHLFFSQLALLPPDERQPLTVGVLERVYRERILGPTCRHYFEHYRQRLKRYGPSLERAAINVLRSVAESPYGRSSWSELFDVYQKARKRASELLFAEMMADLQCDWYLVLDPHTNEYRFMLEVMRQWWRRWFGKPKSPKAERGQ